MWTESRYPNTAAQLARPLTRAHAEGMRGAVSAPAHAHASWRADRSTPYVDMPWLSAPSGGKVIPVDGQEHPRTEL
jgi:hypothetical protein